jgi:hypothetical protein
MVEGRIQCATMQLYIRTDDVRMMYAKTAQAAALCALRRFLPIRHCQQCQDDRGSSRAKRFPSAAFAQASARCTMYNAVPAHSRQRGRKSKSAPPAGEAPANMLTAPPRALAAPPPPPPPKLARLPALLPRLRYEDSASCGAAAHGTTRLAEAHSAQENKAAWPASAGPGDAGIRGNKARPPLPPPQGPIQG